MTITDDFMNRYDSMSSSELKLLLAASRRELLDLKVAARPINATDVRRRISRILTWINRR